MGWPGVDTSDISCEDILAGVAGVLEHFVSASADAAAACGKPPAPTAFDADEILPIRSYLYRLARGGLCSKECFVIALVYGERILQSHPDFVISGRNVHRLILVSLMLASKVLDDFYCRNVYYANAGGIPVSVLNDLELTLIFMLDFDVQVQPEEFNLYRDSLRRETIVKAPPLPMLPAVVAPPVVTKPTMPAVTAAAAYHRQWPALPTSVPAQMVMPVTIIPVPTYSMFQHVGQVAFNPHSYLGHCHAHTGHVLPAGHFAPVPPGAGPIRYRW